ncbi:MAG: ribonuclease HII [Candidatus Caldarchaeum sp.]
MAKGLLCGVDEAGRGCVVGPLVIAAVAAEHDELPILKGLGVADSKTLSPQRREEIFEKLRENFRLGYTVVTPRRVSSCLRVNGGEGLNDLEYDVMAELVRRIAPRMVFVDSPDRDVRRARRRLLEKLDADMEVKCMVKGDRRHVLVAAASIVAKVVRDRRVAMLRRRLGDFGSGYPSDPKTRKWLLENLGQAAIRPYIRIGWATLENLKQTRLDMF